jgi:hypothetical protein
MRSPIQEKYLGVDKSVTIFYGMSWLRKGDFVNDDYYDHNDDPVRKFIITS